MSLSFRGGLLIVLNNEFALTGGYDYLEERNHFVIEYKCINRNLSIQHEMERQIVYMKQQENGEWKIGNMVKDAFSISEENELQEIEKYISREHCRGNYVGAGNRSYFHYLMKEFRKIA